MSSIKIMGDILIPTSNHEISAVGKVVLCMESSMEVFSHGFYSQPGGPTRDSSQQISRALVRSTYACCSVNTRQLILKEWDLAELAHQALKHIALMARLLKVIKARIRC